MSSRKIEIFKTSDCIGKERLTKYVQGKMTDAEKHAIEKHLTDCELCSDAAEGLALLTSMKPLDETIRQVSDKYPPSAKQTPSINRWYYAAASVAILIATGWIISNYSFKQENTAEHISTPAAQQKLNTETPPSNSDAKLNESTIQPQPPPPPAEEKMQQASKNIMAAQNAMVAKASTEDKAFAATEPVQNNEAVAEPPSVDVAAPIATESASAGAVAPVKSATKNIEGLKVYDYSGEYKREKNITKEDNGIPARYESRKDMEKSKTLNNMQSRTIAYQDFLSEALADYNNKKYASAINKLQLLLSDNHSDVNALFYTAMSYSESQQYDKALHFLDRLDAQSNNTFNQESAWHRSLLLLQKGEMDKAKELLQKIISAKGFYATAAQQKLSEIK